MRMDPAAYRRIIDYIDRIHMKYHDFECLSRLVHQFPRIPEKTLGSILRQILWRKTAANGRKDKMAKIVKMFFERMKDRKAGVILNIAKTYGVSPVCLARQIIESLPELHVKGHTTGELIKDTTLINHPTLAYEVHLANLFDIGYSPMSSIIVSVIGREYELYLQYCLLRRNISFKDENDLRNLNYRRTPDALLDVPFAVGGKVVKWIESKALFADEVCHLNYMQSQYQRYVEDFGPGLVIYWFGFISLISNNKCDVLVLDDFPQDIFTLH